ncbi:MAG: winged helix-turn-helix transcriptional regulator [Chitinispirillaceae bacterium]|nr:winged helix-turn-helix transcriptional regulator [Chitinispirillaceae bacterium]
MNEKIPLNIYIYTAITKALSDPNRIRALCALRNGELCVCQIIELLGLAPSTISKHMSILKQAGLVDSRKDSRWVYYRLPEKTDNFTATMIKLATSVLEEDKQILADDIQMARITSTGLERVCKQQRNCNEN